ncbi:hypothetical protein Tco_0788686 [Tanacetum coccineum]
MSVKLSDRSFQYPVGIAENMLVEVGKFTFLADFVILEMEKDSKACELIMEWFGIERTIAKEKVYPSRDGILHGLPIESGFVKVQADTVEEGCSAFPVARPTDEVKTLHDALDISSIFDGCARMKAQEQDESNATLPLKLHIEMCFLHTADAVIRVKQKQLNLGVGTEGMIFNIDSAMKHSYSNDDTCFSIDEILEEDFDVLLDEESKILHSIKGTLLEKEILSKFDKFMAMAADENSESEFDTEEPPFEKITINTDYKVKTSLEEPPTDLKLKPLPDNLEYVFLEEPSFLPVIISSKLSAKKKQTCIRP